MNTGFLVFTNFVLVLRIHPLLAGPSDKSAPAWKTMAAELLVLLLMFEQSGGLYGAIGAVIAFSLFPLISPKWRMNGNIVGFILGMLLLAALSVAFSPRGGIHFKPWVGTFSEEAFSWTIFGTCLRKFSQPRELTLLFGLLLAASEANLLIRWCLTALGIKSPKTKNDVIEDGRGRIIGFFERALIFFSL
jgi:hypothetical protein